MADLYRLSWEGVTPFGKGRQYFTPDAFIKTPLDSIPEECWHKTQRVAPLSDLEDQRDTLARWAATGEQPIRNVVCELAYVVAPGQPR